VRQNVSPTEQIRQSYYEQEIRRLERLVKSQKRMIRTLTRQLASANKYRVRFMDAYYN
jgi:hypothetical protein